MSTTETSVTVSASAAKRIGQLIAVEGRAGLKLRVQVTGGGCSGFQYTFDFDDEITEDDVVIERDGVAVLVDTLSLEYMTGSEIDFVDDLIGAAFRITNPNATASCGCGTSFSI